MNATDIIRSGDIYKLLSDEESMSWYKKRVDLYLGHLHWLDFTEDAIGLEYDNFFSFQEFVSGFEDSENICVYGAGKSGGHQQEHF